MVAPLGMFYLAHGRGAGDRSFGVTIIIACLAAIAASGSRGGYLGFILAGAMFIAMWTVRAVRFNRASLAPALVGLCASIGFAVLIPLILFWPRLHNIVLGGGMEAYSDQARLDELSMAWPPIFSNPITGHGIGLGAFIIGYAPNGFPTIDSYVLSLAVETGVPSLLFFSGMIVLSIWAGVRAYITSPTRSSALFGCIACSLFAFGFYRFFLSQRENHTLFFALIGCAMLLSHANFQSSPISSLTSANAGRPSRRKAEFASRLPELEFGDKSEVINSGRCPLT